MPVYLTAETLAALCIAFGVAAWAITWACRIALWVGSLVRGLADLIRNGPRF